MTATTDRIAQIETRSVDTAEDIDLLSGMVRAAYRQVSVIGASNPTVSSLLSDSAAGFVAERAVNGGSLASNGATLKSLSVAVLELDALVSSSRS